MKVRTEIDIKASRKAVWDIVTDIANAAKRIEAIEKIELLEQPKGKLVGLKWRETRTMFRKQATEVMWITEAKAPEFYETRAESHGSIYKSRLELAEKGATTRLAMEFKGEPVSLGAKIMWGTMGFMFKGATRKALAKDLEDIKKAAEAKA